MGLVLLLRRSGDGTVKVLNTYWACQTAKRKTYKKMIVFETKKVENTDPSVQPQEMMKTAAMPKKPEFALNITVFPDKGLTL